MNSEFRVLLERWGGKEGSIIPLLQQTQQLFGYLSRESMREIARVTRASIAEVYGVATFYSQFRFEARGEHIVKICHGTACHVAGADALDQAVESEFGVTAGQTTADNLFSVERVACLGCCSLAPVVMVDEEVYGRLTGDRLVAILKGLRVHVRD